MPFINTAVLLVIFISPETTRQVLQAIRQVQPPRLYIAADGPRPEVATDVKNCIEASQVVEDIDWSSAFIWFFEHESEGIILEDECVPSQSFFWFCQELLERHRDDYRVMHIGGNNLPNGWQHDADYYYHFFRNGHTSGWATWARAWKYADELKMPLRHSPFVIRDIESDRRFFRTFMKDNIVAKVKTLNRDQKKPS